MMCYRDMTFCSSDCINTECFRNFTDEHKANAQKWWKSFEGEPPVAFSDFSVGCSSYKGPKEDNQ